MDRNAPQVASWATRRRLAQWLKWIEGQLSPCSSPEPALRPWAAHCFLRSEGETRREWCLTELKLCSQSLRFLTCEQKGVGVIVMKKSWLFFHIMDFISSQICVWVCKAEGHIIQGCNFSISCIIVQFGGQTRYVLLWRVWFVSPKGVVTLVSELLYCSVGLMTCRPEGHLHCQWPHVDQPYVTGETKSLKINETPRSTWPSLTSTPAWVRLLSGCWQRVLRSRELEASQRHGQKAVQTTPASSGWSECMKGRNIPQFVHILSNSLK